ncbi:MAG: phenylacetate--CoA ligase family protein [Candidatus Saccharimonadales bacterium]
MSHFPWAPPLYDDPLELIKHLKTQPEEQHLQAGANRAMALFHTASVNVPAYRAHLEAHGFDPASVKDAGDLVAIPATDKSEYLRRHDRSDMCWNGKMNESSWVISTTSGSTGEPFYFPRTAAQDKQYALTAELYLRTQFKIHERSTLYIVAFPMGAWIGGVFTYDAIRRVAERGSYALSVITPGINKLEVIKAVKNLGKDFDQIIIGSYAPFLKDIIDDGTRMGLNWAEYNLGFVFSAEAFGESFRDYVASQTGLTNIYLDTLNHYGTVDLGTMSYETPISVLARRLAVGRPALQEAVFGQIAKIPTLTQFIPEMFYFEEVDGNLYCTANSGLPLVRYDLKDRGGVITLARMEEIFREHGLELRAEAEAVGIADTIWNLPFVYVYERSDLSVSFFAFQIYPETLKKALAEGQLPHLLTGKFTMAVEYDKEGTQHFIVNIELKPETENSDDLKNEVTGAIVKWLLAENSEYRRTHEEYAERVYPIIEFWPYEDPTFFRPGTKQKWAK